MDTSLSTNNNTNPETMQMPQNGTQFPADLQQTSSMTLYETFDTRHGSFDNSSAINQRNEGTSTTSVDHFLLTHQQTANSETSEPGRRSTRVIKRPKFDDELVESIHTIHQQKITPKRRQSHDKSVNNSYEEEQSRQIARKKGSMVDDRYLTPPAQVHGSDLSTPVQQASLSKARKRKAPGQDGETNASKSKKHYPNQTDENEIKNTLKSGNSLAEAAKIIWTPEDDIALIAAVTHVSDLQVVYSQMRFSKRYTLDQIEERWYELLYDEQATRAARKRMETISKERINSIQARIPFSMREEQLVSQVPSNVVPPIHLHLERMLEQNREAFHHARTIHTLEEHWRELKSLYLLADQQPLQNQDDFIEQTYDLQSLAGLDPVGDQLPLDVEERQFTRNVAINERESNEWEAVFTSAITGIAPTNPVMTSETIGLLCGRCTTFDIRKERVLIGRSTKRHNVDVNLTLEGPTAMVSRKQAILKMGEGGECLLRNIGKKYIVVNGQVLVTGEAAKLSHNAIIEVSQIRLKFLKNAEYRQRMMREDGSHSNQR